MEQALATSSQEVELTGPKLVRTNNKEFAAAIPVGELEFLVSTTESFITEMVTKIAEKELDFNSAESTYLTEKAALDELYQEVVQKKTELEGLRQSLESKHNLLESLVSNRGKNYGAVSIRVLRATSHNDDKHKDRKPHKERIDWVTPVVAVLKKQQTFLKPEVLFDILIQEYDHLRARVNSEQFPSAFKSGYCKRFLEMGTLLSDEEFENQKGKKILRPKMLAAVNGFIGLYEWIGVHNKPTDKYAKTIVRQLKPHQK